VSYILRSRRPSDEASARLPNFVLRADADCGSCGRMHAPRPLSLGIATLSLLALAVASAAQPPTTEPTPAPSQPSTPPPTSPVPPSGPVQPAPGPAAPAGPTVPTPPTTAQEEPEPPPPETAVEPRSIPEDLLPTRWPTLLGPSIFVGPDLFNPPAQQGWLSIMPTFTLSGEYDDNVGQRSSDRESDFSIGFTPGLMASVQRRGFTLLAGYNVSGSISVQDASLNNFGKHQQFFGNMNYQVAPNLTFTLQDRFIRDENSNAVTTAGQSVGGRNAMRNTLTPRLRWQATPTTGFGLIGSYTLLRYGETDSESRHRDSDTYRLGINADHQFTNRLTGMLDLTAAYFDFEDESPARTYTLRPGFIYDLTPTLGVRLSAGPSLVDRRGDQEVKPAISAALTQAFKFGSVLVGYDRAVTAGAFDIEDVHSFFAALTVPTLVRGLQFSFVPRYSIVNRDLLVETSGQQTERTTALTLNLRAVYQIARNFSLVGSYTFFHQTDDRGTGDIDQNRVFFGVQYAFPINFY